MKKQPKKVNHAFVLHHECKEKIHLGLLLTQFAIHNFNN